MTFIYSTDSGDYEIEANNKDAAIDKIYRNRKLPTGGWLFEKPIGKTLIGIHFTSYWYGILDPDTTPQSKRYKGHGYVFIFADSKAKAERWFNKHLKGKRYDQSKESYPKDSGRTVYGSIVKSYYAAGFNIGFDADSDSLELVTL